MELSKLIRYARGSEPVDLLLKNAKVIDVYGGEIIPTHVAIASSRIVGLGEYEAHATLDLEGAYLAPGFIDAHVHIESAMVPPCEFARAVAPRGTTTVITDPHEIANVLGLDGIHLMLESAKDSPLSMYVMAPSCVPATHMETSGASLSEHALHTLLAHPWILGLAEVMNFPGVINADPDVIAKINSYRHKHIDGHAPGLTGKELQAYIAAGITTDHECTTPEEAREKISLGMTILIREATNAHNLKTLLPLVNPLNQHRFCFCTDDRQPADLLNEGHIDFMIRTAIDEGIDPIIAIRMATSNTAEHFGLTDRGAIAPGKRADLVAFHNLQAPAPTLVFRGGRLIAKNQQMLLPRETPHPPHKNTINIDWSRVDFAIPAQSSHARVIAATPDQLITHCHIEEIHSLDGIALTDPSRDLLKIAVLERHTASGRMGKGFVKGLGLKKGALASSVAHDHHNLVIIGVDDSSMMTAARHIADMGGGIAVADGDQLLAAVPLPLAGLMSLAPIQEVRDQIDKALHAAKQLGSTLHDPFMAMSFLALEVIPELKITDLGLVDVNHFTLTDLWTTPPTP